MSEYETFSRGSLKLKTPANVSIKKKKKKKKNSKEEKEKLKEVTITSSVDERLLELEQCNKPQRTKTKAEMAFEEQRERNNMKRILQKASKTHKQHVEEFNKHLDNLSEHYDIPKVSWTK